MNFAEMAFYAETEGFLPTKTGKMYAVVNEIKEKYLDEVPFEDFVQILKKHGLSFEKLSEEDKRWIDKMIA